MKKSISQNSFYYFLGTSLQKIFAFFYFLFLARYLGPENLGKYTFSIYFVTLFVVLADFGLGPLLVREVAKDENKKGKYFSTTLILKILFSLFCYLLIVLIINLLNYPFSTKILVYLSGLWFILSVIADTIFALFRGLQNIKYEGIEFIIFQGSVLFFGILGIIFKMPLIYFIWVLILGGLIRVIYGLWVFKRRFFLKFFFLLDKKIAKRILRSSLPFFLLGVFGTLFSYIDIVILSFLRGDQFVGYYSAAQKIPNSIRIIPIALTVALYPAASFYFKKNKEYLQNIVQKSFNYLLILALPIVFGLFFFSPWIIKIIYGQDFIPSILALRFLSFSMLFIFLDYLFFTTLNAIGKEKFSIISRFIGAISIITLNLILVPFLAHLGTAISYSFSFFILASLGFIFLQRVIKLNLVYSLILFLKSLFSSILMTGFIFYFTKIAFWWLGAILAPLVYFLFLYIFKGFSKQDWLYFKSFLEQLKLLKNFKINHFSKKF